jgi:hypothetical protein
MKRVAGLDPDIGGVDRAALRHSTTRVCTASLFHRYARFTTSSAH